MYEVEKLKINQNGVEINEITLDKDNIANFELDFILPTKKILNSKLIVMLVSVAQDRVLILHDEVFENDLDAKEYTRFVLNLNNTSFLGEGLYNFIVCSVPLEDLDSEEGVSIIDIINLYSQIFRTVRAL